MFIAQTIKFEFRWLVPLGRLCTLATDYFYDKTKISKENLRVDYYLQSNFDTMPPRYYATLATISLLIVTN